ncbi:putative Chaperone protein ClpB1 [Blattamonas nauphoetae]|uniref:Chaperone protein ClpB1 n=1 Tax=Blattamonas nauphoetae TaxID=2049346 RepID=A0ABQ9XB53_9EUKA|nr:putative Chaperone protein ClpB1 [Blattamonas nauphoetae]
MSLKLTSKSIDAITTAQTIARRLQHGAIFPVHLALALFEGSDSIGLQVCKKLGIEGSKVLDSLEKISTKYPKQTPVPEQLSPATSFSGVLQRAEEKRNKMGDEFIAVDHLLSALIGEHEIMVAFNECGISPSMVEEAITNLRKGRRVTSESAEDNYDALEKYARDLTALAANGELDPVIGRDEEIRRTIQVLCRRTKNNPALTGLPGVGKTAIVEGLAQRIVKGDVPKGLDCKVYSLDMGSLLAGTKYRGEFESRMKELINEITSAKGSIILFIDEMHLLLGAGSAEGSADAANLLKPALARGELRCIGATTDEEYKKYIGSDSALERRFQPIRVCEPSVQDSISIMRGLKERYELFHGVHIQDGAVVAAVELSNRYITQRFLPDKAIDVIDEACSSVRVQLDSQPQEIDRLERKILQLQVEKTALEKEKDKDSKQRLRKIEDELKELNNELTPLKEAFDKDREIINELNSMLKKRDAIKVKLEQAERKRDLATTADLRYGALPDIEQRIDTLQRKKDEQETSKQMLCEEITADTVRGVVSRWTGIPIERLSQTERDRLLTLEDRLHERVIGQNEAVRAVANAILRSRAGLTRSTQPTGSFLFLGPSGVGKTELAKALSCELFDSEKAMVRLDMSEYMEEHTVSKLIGAPPGYIGHDAGGQLTDAIRKRPYSVVLLDEVEKAHPKVLNILLQVLEDGRLTDSKGRIADFTNTLVIMTSNLGSSYLCQAAKEVGQSGSAKDSTDVQHSDAFKLAKHQALEAVRQHFRPELINRLDSIVVFTPLLHGDLVKIVDKQCQTVVDRMAEKNVTLIISDATKDYVVKSIIGESSEFGARPVRRFVEQDLVTELSKSVIRGDAVEGSTLTITPVPDAPIRKNGRLGSTGSKVLDLDDIEDDWNKPKIQVVVSGPKVRSTH